MRLRPLDENRRGHAQCCATATYERMLHDLQPGLNECAVHPAQGAKATIRRPSLYRCRGRAAPIDPRTASPNRVSRILAVTVGALSGSPSRRDVSERCWWNLSSVATLVLGLPGLKVHSAEAPAYVHRVGPVTRAVCSGTPVLAVPFVGDQALVAEAVVQTRLGPSSLADEVSVEGLRASLDELIAWYKRPPRPPQKLPRRWLL